MIRGLLESVFVAEIIGLLELLEAESLSIFAALECKTEGTQWSRKLTLPVLGDAKKPEWRNW